MPSKKTQKQQETRTAKQLGTKVSDKHNSFVSFSSYSFVNHNGQTHEKVLDIKSKDGLHVDGHLVEKKNNKKIVDKHFTKLSKSVIKTIM